jgi:hypothetical protein
MFPKDVPEQFSREQGCTLAEWLRDLAGAVKHHRLEAIAPGAAVVHVTAGGHLHLQWQELPPRRIGMARLPRLQVDFRFEAVSAESRTDFMRYFDLFMQKGGG